MVLNSTLGAQVDTSVHLTFLPLKMNIFHFISKTHSKICLQFNKISCGLSLPKPHYLIGQLHKNVYFPSVNFPEMRQRSFFFLSFIFHQYKFLIYKFTNSTMNLIHSLFWLTSLIYVKKFELENPAIMEDKQCKWTKQYSVMAKGSDCFLSLDDKSKQRYTVKINNIQGYDPYQIKEKPSGNISKFPLFAVT